MNIKKLSISGLYIIEPRVFEDDRGYFYESYRRSVFKEAGIQVSFVQDNVSRSRAGTLRGLHYQIRSPQAKLIQCLKGRILDVAVDLRRSSDSFGKYYSLELSESNKKQFFIPEGFAHGFSVLSDEAIISYKCSDYYNPEGERGIRWDDPSISIDWRVEDCVLSDKDCKLPYLKELEEQDLFK
ncbi:dTDP-4-dehydrorhamnose 3,5-epimerase [Balneola sp. MJW-20]|uniref:dTDP-4-dehydrorhamnose 3,5-epimerase n=1 Tax=Gracilimonas aurantiaca TaxID=3234185 RepID=UPI003466DD41